MKKHICFALLISAFGTFLTAQEDSQELNSKKWLISMNTPVGAILGDGNLVPGTIGFISTKTEDYTNYILSLGGGFGYQIVENFYGGLNLSYGRSWDDTDGDYTSTTVLVGPQVRYYVPFGQSSLVIGANGSFGSVKNSYDIGDFTTKLSGFGGMAGYVYSVNSTIDLEAQLSYDTVTAKDDDDDDDESTASVLGVRLGFSIRL